MTHLLELGEVRPDGQQLRHESVREGEAELAEDLADVGGECRMQNADIRMRMQKEKTE